MSPLIWNWTSEVRITTQCFEICHCQCRGEWEKETMGMWPKVVPDSSRSIGSGHDNYGGKQILSYCYWSPNIAAQFPTRSVVKEALWELDTCVSNPSQKTCGVFILIRNNPMICANLTNARQTGDLRKLTQEHQMLKANHKNHIVQVHIYKIATGWKPCKGNLGNKSNKFGIVQKYENIFHNQLKLAVISYGAQNFW